MAKKILFIAPYPFNRAPSQRLKFEQYYPSFRKHGFEITHSSFISYKMWDVIYKNGNFALKLLYTLSGYFSRAKLLLKINSYDVVYLHLWATPFGPPIFEWVICKLSRKIIYDIDDLVFLKNIAHENKLTGLLKGKNKPIFMMKHADHVISCTPFLNNIALQYNKHSTDISSTVDTKYYLPVNNYKNDHQLILGWSGSHSTSRYLYLLKDILIKLASFVDFKLLVIGDPNFYIPNLNIEAVQWSNETELSNLQKIDIGLYPLPLDDEWVFGKSGLKAIQYMALGIPTIATNIGCNDRVITNGISGYLVTTQQQWFDTLLMLYNQPVLRKLIGTEARLKVEREFSIAVNESTYLNIII